MYRHKKNHVYVTYIFGNLRNISIFRSQNTSAYMYNQSSGIYGTINDSMTDKTLTLRQIYEYASERSERA